MLEYFISKGTCPFLEQNESKNTLMKKLTKSMRVLRDKLKGHKEEESKSGPQLLGGISTAEQPYLKLFKYAGEIRSKIWKENVNQFEDEMELTHLKSELSKRINKCKLSINKIQSVLEMLHANINSETKQNKDTHALRAEGAKLIYEILIGKTFEIDAFEMKDSEVQKMRSEHIASSDSLHKKYLWLI